MLALLLALATILLYAPAVGFDFVDYDDRAYVTDNPHVQRGLDLETLRWAATARVASHWHPLTLVSHALDWQLYGAWAGGHHATSVALHVLNVVLLFALLVRSTAAPVRSLLVAAIFALHPLRVESVAWIAERKDVLSAAFFLAALHAWVSWVRRPSGARYLVVLLALAAGLLAKPMILTFPVVALAFDVWPLRRREPILRRVVEKLPFFALSGVSALAAMLAASERALMPLAQAGLPLRLENAVVSLGWYLAKAVWPSGLGVLYMHPGAPGGPPITWPQVVGALGLVLALSAWAWRERRRGYPLVGWTWYVVILLPVLGLLQAGLQARADRYTYLALVGPSVMLLWRLGDWLDERAASRTVRRTLGAASAVVLVAYAMATRAQLEAWRGPITLYERAIAVEPGNFMMHFNLGTQLNRTQRYDDALAAFERAAAINPGHAATQRALGEELERRGRVDEAIARYREAARLEPHEPSHLRSLGDGLLAAGDAAGAAALYRRALALDPEDAKAHNNLGNALVALGDPTGARAAYERALVLDPSLAATHGNLAASLEEEGRGEEALAHRREHARLAPDSPDALHALAVALLATRDTEGALVVLRDAHRFAPGRADVAQLAAWVLATRPAASSADAEEAIRLAERAVRASDDALALTTLAVAQGAAGRFEEASLTSARARTRAEETGETDLVAALDDMRAAFARREPWRGE